MKRVSLTKSEKCVLRFVSQGCGTCPDNYPAHVFNSCVRSLERKGLIKGAFVEGGEVFDSHLTDDGHALLSENPTLKNPIDWKWIITTTIASIAAIASITAFFVACGNF